MKKQASIVAALLIISFPLNAAVNTPFFSKTYWINFDWGKVEQSDIYTDPEFHQKDIESKDGLEVYEKFKDVQIDGNTFVQSVTKHKRINNERSFSLSLKQPKFSMCDAFRSKVEKAFGKKYDFIDNSIGVATNTPMVNKYWQWHLGSSTVGLQCLSQLNDDRFSDINISFSPNDDFYKMPAPISVNCTRTLSYINKEAKKELSPIQLIFLPKKKILLNLDRNIIGDVSEITSSQISFLIERDGIAMEFLMNRHSGNLTGTVKSLATGDVIANFNGSCNSIASEARKF